MHADILYLSVGYEVLGLGLGLGLGLLYYSNYIARTCLNDDKYKI